MEEAIHCLKGCLISYRELFLDNELGSVDELPVVGIWVDCTSKVKVALV